MDESKTSWETGTVQLNEEYSENKLTKDDESVSFKVKAALKKKSSPRQKPRCTRCKKWKHFRALRGQFGRRKL